MARKPLDLTHLKEIPIIKEHLAKNHINQDQYKEYFLAFNHIYPKLIETFGSFEVFLDSDENEKSKFLNDWFSEQYDYKKKEKPDNDLIAMKNTILRDVWEVQGLLGKLGKKYKANPELLETQQPNSNLTLAISFEDVLKLYDVLPTQYKLILKIMMISGLDPIDIVDFRLSDFKEANENFYYIYKPRTKTKEKGVYFLLIFDREFYGEIAEYVKNFNIDIERRKSTLQKRLRDHPEEQEKVETEINKISNVIGINGPIFPISKETVSTEIKHYLRKYQLNPKTLPRYIRQLSATLLEDILPSKYLLLWSQHKAELMDRHYLKQNVDKFIQFYPLIAQKVLIHSSYQSVKLLNDKIKQEEVNQQIYGVLQDIVTNINKNPPKNENIPSISNGNEPLITDQPLQTLKEKLEKLQKLLQK